ncbi:TetR/AcrR family transcriptional regulator [Kiloniella majae]|uniref:TetR/AcrR family transcriptional regulator n=1 Tax=Kiloniella majae TaxID=1938558 RepID=UPI0015C4E930|nr:TetR/AcrR family transcriptional regulator [Kiloniella majae]
MTSSQAMSKTIPSGQSWLNAAMEILSEEGFQTLNIPRLCQKLQLTKGSFYHHFKNFAAFKQELLAFWEKDFTQDIFEEINSVEDPEAKYEMLFNLAFEKDLAVDLAIRSWAQADNQVRDVVSKVDEMRINILADMYQKASDLSEDAARNYAVIDYTGYIGFYSLFPDAPDSWARDLASIQTRSLLADSKMTGGKI